MTWVCPNGCLSPKPGWWDSPECPNPCSQCDAPLTDDGWQLLGTVNPDNLKMYKHEKVTEDVEVMMPISFPYDLTSLTAGPARIYYPTADAEFPPGPPPRVYTRREKLQIKVDGWRWKLARWIDPFPDEDDW